MNVLSLFDGMSCGQLALKKQGIKVDKYYASEIDKNAIKVTQNNFPETIQIGDVTKINACDLKNIDLLIGGSPCQGFSINGKQLNFKDERSKLLFEFIKIRDILKPKYWLLENVATMNSEIKIAIDDLMGVKGRVINSNFCSAQNRKRLYWTNIDFTVNNTISKQVVNDILDLSYSENLKWLDSKINQQYILPTETDGVITLNPKRISGEQTYQQDRIYDSKGKYVALTATLGNRFNILDNFSIIRKLSIREQARLQKIPDNYSFDCISNLSASKVIGNGWTVDVIAHILSFMK